MKTPHLCVGSLCCVLLLAACGTVPRHGSSFGESSSTSAEPQQLTLEQSPQQSPEQASNRARTSDSGRRQAGTMDANAQGTQDGSRDDTRTTEPRQTSYTGFREGDWDVMLAGSGNNDKRWTSGAGSLAASVGYLLTDELEVSVRQSLLMADSPGSESVAIGASAVAIDYHVTMGGVYPFVGANFGRVYGDTIDDTWTAAPEAGVKVFLQRDAYLLVMAEYELGFDDAEEIDDGWKDGTFVYKVGFGLRF